MKTRFERIALLGNGFSSWGGGVDFLRFCANSLSLVDTGRTELYILLPDPEYATFTTKAKRFISPLKRRVKSLFTGGIPCSNRQKAFTRNQLIDSFKNIEGNATIVFYPPVENIAALLASIRADVVIPCAFSLGSVFPIPWVGYLYDFQHKYYPQFFAADEITLRDAQFCQMLTDAKAVIVNSADVKKDAAKFFPQTKCEIFELPFSATPIESWFEQPTVELATKYDLPEHYFVICNQFWIHKDHKTAFRALAAYSLITARQNVHIVCTGNTVDFRNPDFFVELEKNVSELGLTSRIHFLGYIPKKDQIDIMCGSIAVLQPTLFEGGPGGGAVYDAVAMGVQAIVSDIQVNREIDGIEGVVFFKAGDADDLAAKMAAVQNRIYIRQSKESLLAVGRERTRAFGHRLLEAVEYVMQQRNIAEK